MSDDGELPLGRRSGKSDAAFRTISEVADELDVPQHVLRFWESKFPQVRPLKRGGGRRYYRPEDVALLRRIRDLLYSEGYTIKGVQKLLREGSHKESPAARPEAESTAAEPQPQLGFAPHPELQGEEADFPAMDDGEESGEGDDDLLPAQNEPGERPHPAASAILPAPIRKELKDLLAELEQLRGLLQPRPR